MKKKNGINRYMTRGIAEQLNPMLLMYIWKLQDDLRMTSKEEIDYLQVYEIKNLGKGIVQIKHSSECPEYKATYMLEVKGKINFDEEKIYIISDYPSENEIVETILYSSEY